jgi:hypothetical protein
MGFVEFNFSRLRGSHDMEDRYPGAATSKDQELVPSWIGSSKSQSTTPLPCVTWVFARFQIRDCKIPYKDRWLGARLDFQDMARLVPSAISTRLDDLGSSRKTDGEVCLSHARLHALAQEGGTCWWRPISNGTKAAGSKQA